jgi:ribosomal protein S12 methylthiotransferase
MAKVSIVSLGCDKNRIDGEKMLGFLNTEGVSYTKNLRDADFVIVNTCGFIDKAKEESIEHILDLADKKREGIFRYLIVTGCLAQRYYEELLEQIPEIDGILGTGSYNNIVNIVEKLKSGDKVISVENPELMPVDWDVNRIPIEKDIFSYVKIAEGCDNHCTYCIIPSLRGKFRSRSKDSIITEVNQLVSRGVKEIILIAQDTSSYGLDIYDHYNLSALIKDISNIPGDFWIRIMYCYPEKIDQALIEAIANNKKVCNYLDIPLQHANNKILKKMGRRTTKESITDTIRDIKKRIPDIVIRTTFIVGFPGETLKELQELSEFIKEIGFNHVGVFSYSREEGTPAYNMKPHLSNKEKDKRMESIILTQQIESRKKNERLIGKPLDVLVEGYDSSSEKYYGRYYGQAPEIDGLVWINKNTNIKLGFNSVIIIDVNDYDLIGVIKDEPSQ